MSETNSQEGAVAAAAAFGWLGFVMGAAALILAVTITWAGPLAPQQTAGVTLGNWPSIWAGRRCAP